MTIRSFSSREFNQRISQAKKAADNGPVFITVRGKPSHVLLSIKDYQKLTGKHDKISDLLGMPGIEDVHLDIPSLKDLPEPPDLS